MLRVTQRRPMKPFLHALSPGVRPSEKGNLYRNNNQNAHARIASIQNAQRTWKEMQIFKLLMVPDQIFGFLMVISLGFFTAIAVYISAPSEFTMNHQHELVGGMNEHEFFKRNSEMSSIFEHHREMIKNSRALVEQPDVFNAPEGYTSNSGLFTPKKFETKA